MIPATNQTKIQVDKFLATGDEAKTIRTIWYQIKAEMKPWQGNKTEKAHADYINEIIGNYLWEIFLNEEPGIYYRLGLQTKAIQEGKYPVVLFCEKDLGMFDFLDEELLQSVYLSSGQIPSYEVALLAYHLMWKNEVWIVTANDIDPAGYNITENLVTKLQLAFTALGYPETVVHHLPVTVQDPFQYETYTLALDQQKKWSLCSQGVELDAIPVNVLEASVTEALDAIPREVFKPLAIRRKREELFDAALEEDPKHQKLLTKIRKRQEKIRKDIYKIPLTYHTDFDYDHKGVLIENVDMYGQ